MKITDLSYELDDSCMTCGTAWHEKVSLTPLGTISEVGRNTHRIVMGSHSGTHMDAPLHFIDGADGINRADLEKICGPCSIVDMTEKTEDQIVEKQDIETLTIAERMLFRFDWFRNWKTDRFYKGYPYFSIGAARMLVDGGMKVIALDTPSPDSGKSLGKGNDSPVHKLFLENGVTIIEYLTQTDRLDPCKSYQLVALPLKLKDCDGSPARVIMVETE